MRYAALLVCLTACFFKPEATPGRGDGGNGSDGSGSDASGSDGSMIDARPLDDPTINLAFVTYFGSATGLSLATADMTCRNAAVAAGRTGMFRAFMTSQTQNIADRFGTARGWQRADGKPFLDRLSDQKVFYPLTLDAFGAEVDVDNVDLFVATATRDDNAHAEDCTGFTGVGTVRYGRADADYPSWKDDGDTGCSNTVFIYCLQIDLMKMPPLPLGTGKRAFVSAPFGIAGIAQLDTHCSNEAGTGSFKALVALSTTSARARFSSTVGPYVRDDGVIVSMDLTRFVAPLDQAVNGAPVDGQVSVGASSLTAPAMGTNCSNWMTGGTGLPSAGRTARSNVGAFSGGSSVGCGLQHRVYCVQD